MMTIDPFRPVKLGGTLALATILSGGVVSLPPGNLADGLRTIAGFTAVGLSTKVTCETLADDAKADDLAQDSEVKATLTTELYRANAAYYREYPHHWKARKDVPDEWLELWGQTGGKPYLALHPSSPQAFAPVAPIAQPQPQPQTIQEPGQTRGGSFDRAAASESPGTGWGDFEPRDTISPIAQTPIAPKTQPEEWEPDAIDLHAPDESWIDSLLRPSVLLVYGSDGSGKTSMARELLARRQAANHQTFALDPHSHPGKWGTCEVIGAGMGHKAIAAFVGRLQAIIKDRYERISSGEVAPGSFRPISIVCEELTDWAGEVTNSDLLLAKAGHYRKANVHLILVSHGDKLGQLGSPKGFADMANRILTKLKLESKPGHDGEPIPAFKGLLTQPNCQPVPVVVPRFGGSHVVSTEAPGTFGNTLPESWERQVQPTLQPAKLALVPGSVPNVPDREPLDNTTPDTDNRFFARPDDREVMGHCMALGMNPEQMQFVMFDRVGCGNELAAFTQCRSLGMNQEQCIFATFYCRKGRETKSDGSPSKYGLAKHYYDQMIQESNAA